MAEKISMKSEFKLINNYTTVFFNYSKCYLFFQLIQFIYIQIQDTFNALARSVGVHLLAQRLAEHPSIRRCSCELCEWNEADAASSLSENFSEYSGGSSQFEWFWICDILWGENIILKFGMRIILWIISRVDYTHCTL